MLAPDVNATEQSLDNFSTVMNAIGTYCVYMVLANTGPVDVLGTNTDLLSNLPGVKSGIAEAKKNALTFIDLGVPTTVLQAISNYNSSFQITSGEILDALNAAIANPNGQPTPAQQQTITTGLESLQTALVQQQSAVEGVVVPTKAFSQQVTNDHANLSDGENSISNAISSITQWVYSAGEAAMGGPGGEAAANTIAAVGKSMTDALNLFLTNLEGLVSKNEIASDALTDMLTIWSTLVTKYGDVISNLQQAGGGGILAPGDVRSAQAAWTELSNYAQTLLHPGGN